MQIYVGAYGPYAPRMRFVGRGAIHRALGIGQGYGFQKNAGVRRHEWRPYDQHIQVCSKKSAIGIKIRS